MCRSFILPEIYKPFLILSFFNLQIFFHFMDIFNPYAFQNTLLEFPFPLFNYDFATMIDYYNNFYISNSPWSSQSSKITKWLIK